MEIERDENGNLPCPFCGGAVDPTGWLSEDIYGSQCRGPECDGCGVTAPNIEIWNSRTTVKEPNP